jgi:hypothetical protein
MIGGDAHGRFEDRKRSDAFFKAAYSKRIPADGFPEFAARIWVCHA